MKEASNNHMVEKFKAVAADNEALQLGRARFITEQKSFLKVRESLFESLKIRDAIDRESSLNKKLQDFATQGAKISALTELERVKQASLSVGALGAIESITKEAKRLAAFDNLHEKILFPSIGIAKQAMALGIDAQLAKSSMLAMGAMPRMNHAANMAADPMLRIDHTSKLVAEAMPKINHAALIASEAMSKMELLSNRAMKESLAAIAGSMEVVSKIGAMDFEKLGLRLSPIMPAMASIASLSHSTEMLSSIRNVNLGIDFSAHVRGEERFKKLANSYERTLIKQPASIFFEEMPREIELASAALTTLRTGQTPNFREFRITEKVRATLQDFDTELVVIFDGARQALNDKRPDYARQAAASFRALLNALIHWFAPTEETMKWIDGRDKMLHNGRPTRRARLEYIFRNQKAAGQFSVFIKKDIDAILSLFDILSSEDHVTVSNLSDPEIRIMESRISSFVETVIVLNRSN